MDEVWSNLTLFRQEWDRRFPDNRVFSQEPDDE